MKIDIFEDVKERVGCDNISDLPYRKCAVWEEIKTTFTDSISKRTVRKVFPLCIWCRLCCYNGNTGNEERK